MKELLPYIFIDVACIFLCIGLVWRTFTFWHPFSIYIFFHGYSFTFRAYQLWNGASPMYAENPAADIIKSDEIIKGLLIADLAIIAFALGSYIAQKIYFKDVSKSIRRTNINKTIILLVCLVCLPPGIFVLLQAKTGFTANFFSQSNYYQVLAMWPISCLYILVFTYGWRWWTSLSVFFYLSMVALQGYHRTMLILPIIFFIVVFLLKNRRRWLGVGTILPLLFLFIIFARLKYIGRAFQNQDFSEMWFQFSQSFKSSSGADEQDSEQFLDQYCGFLTMTDAAQKVGYGSNYLAILVLPIPREIWPGKPGQADHIAEVSTPTRQYDREGRITTYIGEAYYNFRYLGVFFIALFSGYILTRWCLRSVIGPFRRLEVVAYTLFFTTFIQFYRDGFSSIVIFGVAQQIPFITIFILHKSLGSALKTTDESPVKALGEFGLK